MLWTASFAISAIAEAKEFLYLDGDTYSASSVYVKDNGAWNLYYICRDYLGSITHLTDANGVVLQKTSYDAWGRLRDPQTQVLYNDDNQPELFLRRGYTSHEHLPWFGLTNMNARLYDPVLGRFLSPDPYVQMPDFSQSFNRYAYAHNNPLKFIDPSGESIIGAIIVGAIIGGMVNLNVQAMAGNINSYGDMFASFGMGALAGGLGGAAGVAVGGLVAGAYSTVATSASQFIFRGALAGASGGIAGGFVGGAVTAWGNGASFVDGLKAGGISGGIGGLLGGLSGGIGGAKQFNNIKQTVANIDGSAISTDSTGQLVKNDQTLNQFSDTYFKDVTYRDEAVLKYDHASVRARGDDVLAYTDGKNRINGKILVRFSNEAFHSKLDMYMTMGHEYVHVSQFIEGHNVTLAIMECNAYQWNRNVLANSKMVNHSWYKEVVPKVDDLVKNIRALGFKHVNALTSLNWRSNSWGLPTVVPIGVR